MGKDKAKRIYLSLKAAMYDELSVIAHMGGFKDVRDLTVTALDVMIDCRRRAAERRDVSEAIEDEIADMFADLCDNEPQPDGTVPVRHNNKMGYE